MSRSYKHTPIFKMGMDTKYAKRCAARKYRHNLAEDEAIKKSNYYRRFVNDYGIYEYSDYCLRKDEKWWYRYYLRK